eukprot:NODE_890_length_1843_cov_17.190078_g788_i0.p1 GENE.NODE_890_length_1843_cov_17.190078_g788_i0~~NODE_890_length_1843_cov_17.190078_g788_i0.p1  ORF type:complete len:348 (-),score=64.48 NODE_890_length_1843_cov_17.190078_g788_i0:798-1787(-)
MAAVPPTLFVVIIVLAFEYRSLCSETVDDRPGWENRGPSGSATSRSSSRKSAAGWELEVQAVGSECRGEYIQFRRSCYNGFDDEGVPLPYFNWATPSSLRQGFRRCITLETDGTWWNVDCGTQEGIFSFVCEQALPANASTSMTPTRTVPASLTGTETSSEVQSESATMTGTESGSAAATATDTVSELATSTETVLSWVIASAVAFTAASSLAGAPSSSIYSLQLLSVVLEATDSPFGSENPLRVVLRPLDEVLPLSSAVRALEQVDMATDFSERVLGVYRVVGAVTTTGGPPLPYWLQCTGWRGLWSSGRRVRFAVCSRGSRILNLGS